ncbi:MAG: Xaa-Pro peptidase family protein [Burkholderiaceae bacterium]
MALAASPQADWTTSWSTRQLESNRHALYLARLQRLREFMRRANLPVLLVMDANNIFYATGARNMTIFALRSPSRYLLAFADGPAELFEYAGSEHLAAGLPTIDRITPAISVGYLGSGGAMTAACEQFAREISARVRAVDPTITCLAVDRFPFIATDALRKQGFTLRDADAVFVPARAIKLPIEIPYLREAMRRVQEGVRALEQALEPGRSETEVWAHLWFDVMQKDGQFLTTRLCQSGPHTFPYFQEAGSRLLQSGELLCLDTDAQGYEGYAVDLSRTFLCGDSPPSADQRQLYQLAQEQVATNAALLAPGMEFRELAERAWACPQEYRPYRYGLIGHGLGLAGEFPNIPHHEAHTPYPLAGHIEPGMVLCLESYIGSPRAGQGVKLENQYLVHDRHVECLSTYPMDRRLGGAR